MHHAAMQDARKRKAEKKEIQVKQATLNGAIIGVNTNKQSASSSSHGTLSRKASPKRATSGKNIVNFAAINL